MSTRVEAVWQSAGVLRSAITRQPDMAQMIVDSPQVISDKGLDFEVDIPGGRQRLSDVLRRLSRQERALVVSRVFANRESQGVPFAVGADANSYSIVNVNAGVNINGIVFVISAVAVFAAIVVIAAVVGAESERDYQLPGESEFAHKRLVEVDWDRLKSSSLSERLSALSLKPARQISLVAHVATSHLSKALVSPSTLPESVELDYKFRNVDFMVGFERTADNRMRYTRSAMY